MKVFSQSLVARLVGSFLLLSAATVIAVSTIAYFRAKNALMESVFDRLRVAVTLKENELSRWIDDQQREVVYLAKSP